MKQQTTSEIIDEIKAGMTVSANNIIGTEDGLPLNDFVIMVDVILNAIDVDDKELLASLPFEDPKTAINYLSKFSQVWEASQCLSLK